MVAWLLHTAALWAWHAPPLYQAALDLPALHGIEHLSFLGTGLLFWWTVLAPGCASTGILKSPADGVRPRRPLDLRAHPPERPARGADDVRAVALVPGLRGQGAVPWGLAPLEDRRLAVNMMWVPGGMIYAAVALGLLAVWIPPAQA